MFQKFCENVEISNEVNICDKIFVITQRFCDFKTMCTVLLGLLSQHD